MANFADALFRGMDDAAAQRSLMDAEKRRSGLASLAQQAYAAQPAQRQGLVSQAIGLDPDAGFALDKQLQGGEDRRREQLVNLARGWKQVPTTQKQSYYERFVAPAVGQMGFGDLGQYDEKSVDGVADQILAAYGPGKAINPYDGLPADIQSLRLLQDNPQLAALDKERRQYSGMVPKLVETSQGIGWGKPGAGIQLAPLEGVAGQGAPSQAAPQAAELFAALSNKYGIQPTSVLRTPERNRQVGGVNNSYHLSGQAADWVVPQPLKAQFIADARAYGYEAIDEGDHVHIEPAGRGSGAAAGVAQPYQKPQAPSELERRIALAREMGASEDDIRRMLIGREGAAAGAKPLPVSALKELLDIENAIGSSQQVASTLQRHAQRMQDGSLSVTPVNSALAKARTALGIATPNDVNISELKSDITRVVNEWLRLNKGVQTEGDAQREFKAIMDSNDPTTIARSIQRLSRIIQNTVGIQNSKRDVIRRNYGQDSSGRPAQQDTQPQSSSIDDLLEKYK